MRRFPRLFLKWNRRLVIVFVLLLVAGCASPTDTEPADPPAQSEEESAGGGVDEDGPLAQVNGQETPPVPDTAVPTSTATLIPTPTPTLTSVPTVEVTATVALSTTTTPITGTVPVEGTPTGESQADGGIDPSAVNGIPIDSIIVLPEEVAENVRQIFARGQALDRDPRAFSKLGDSLIATPSFLTRFDVGPYNLGVYDYLQPAIDYYAGSFERYGVALRPGLHAWGVFDPLWANKEWCQPNENLLACEFRLNNPSVVLILLGTNDTGNPPGFDHNMRNVVEFSIENGVIPVIVTKADRFEGPENTNNNILRQVAADYQIPLWDFDLVAETLPGRGLLEDQVHLTVFVENDYTMPEAYQTGTGVHNLTGLMALDAVRRAISE